MTQKTQNEQKPFNIAVQEEMTKASEDVIRKHPELESVVVTLCYYENCGDPSPSFLITGRNLSEISSLLKAARLSSRTSQHLVSKAAAVLNYLQKKLLKSQDKGVKEQQTDRPTDTKGSSEGT